MKLKLSGMHMATCPVLKLNDKKKIATLEPKLNHRSRACPLTIVQ